MLARREVLFYFELTIAPPVIFRHNSSVDEEEEGGGGKGPQRKELWYTHMARSSMEP